jgi:hypothetical protein
VLNIPQGSVHCTGACQLYSRAIVNGPKTPVTLEFVGSGDSILYSDPKEALEVEAYWDNLLRTHGHTCESVGQYKLSPRLVLTELTSRGVV